MYLLIHNTKKACHTVGKLSKAALFLFLQGMVEVVAENYHNIWAKKKKTELVSKGVQIVVKFYEQQSRCYLFVLKRKRLK